MAKKDGIFLAHSLSGSVPYSPFEYLSGVARFAETTGFGNTN